MTASNIYETTPLGKKPFKEIIPDEEPNYFVEDVEEFEDKPEPKQIIQEQEPQQENRLKCPFCEKTFQGQQSLSNHIRTKHPLEKKSQFYTELQKEIYKLNKSKKEEKKISEINQQFQVIENLLDPMSAKK